MVLLGLFYWQHTGMDRVTRTCVDAIKERGYRPV
jgi:hypothetical protein